MLLQRVLDEGENEGFHEREASGAGGAWAVTVWKFQEPGGRLTAMGSRAFTLPVKTCF